MRPLSLRAPRSDSADASTIVAFFTQRFISRGNWEVEGGALLLNRGTLGSDNAGGAAAAAQATVSNVGLLLSDDELLLLGPDGVQGGNAGSLLEQLGLQSWRDAGLSTVPAAAAAERSVGGLGGGFKRFLWEPHARGVTVSGVSGGGGGGGGGVGLVAGAGDETPPVAMT